MGLTPEQQKLRDDVGYKIKQLHTDIVREVRAIAPKVVALKFVADGSHKRNTTRIEVDGTDVEVDFVSEWKGYSYSNPTGKVRVVVGRWSHAKRFMDKKDGHDVRAIAERIVWHAAETVRQQASTRAHMRKREEVEAQAHGINAAYGVEPYRSEVYVVEEHEKLSVRIPYFTDQEKASQLVAFVQKLLAK